MLVQGSCDSKELCSHFITLDLAYHVQYNAHLLSHTVPVPPQRIIYQKSQHTCFTANPEEGITQPQSILSTSQLTQGKTLLNLNPFA